jgi:adenine-specific DNA-methyltransferase
MQYEKTMSKNPTVNYITKAIPSSQKLRGGYYTPKMISKFLAQWAIQSPYSTVLEPSCGDGNLLVTAAEVLLQKGAKAEEVATNLHGVEIEATEALKATERLNELGIPKQGNLVEVGDFFAYCKQHLNEKRLFDAVIGNPPFIRYQNFVEEHRKPAFELMAKVGLKPNRLTNTWVPFLLASSLLLKETGRLAMIIPAELLQVKYAASLRDFISDYYSNVTLITFKTLVFSDIQQEVVLFLGERGTSSSASIRTIELNDINDLALYNHAEVSSGEVKPMDHSTEKWTQYFLHTPEIELLRKLRSHPGLTVSGKVIDVDVGVVTGLNKFFVLTEEQVKEASLEPYTIKIVGRSAHLSGAIFSGADWAINAEKQLPAFLLKPPDSPFEELPSPLKDYITKGEKEGVNQGYKCSIRRRWYIVPTLWVPDAFMLRQVHAYPKIIVNEAGATCTDTIHRVKLRNGEDPRTIAAAFMNSLTFAFAEVVGRSYGGGVLELEPNEAEELPLPLNGAENLDFTKIHNLLLNDKIEDILNITDQILLIDGLGLSASEVNVLRNIWRTLRDRRINRKHKSEKTKSAQNGQ